MDKPCALPVFLLDGIQGRVLMVSVFLKIGNGSDDLVLDIERPADVEPWRSAISVRSCFVVQSY